MVYFFIYTHGRASPASIENRKTLSHNNSPWTGPSWKGLVLDSLSAVTTFASDFVHLGLNFVLARTKNAIRRNNQTHFRLQHRFKKQILDILKTYSKTRRSMLFTFINKTPPSKEAISVRTHLQIFVLSCLRDGWCSWPCRSCREGKPTHSEKQTF